MKPKFIQRNCIEGNKIDLRQANSILKYRPDIILFELPASKNRRNIIFNKYSANSKPLKKVNIIVKNLKKAAIKYPYALSDVAVWHNIIKLWAEGHNVSIYNVDAPDRLRREYFLKYEEAKRDLLFWVYLYIREEYMADNIEKILKKYNDKRNPVVAVLIQSIHWNHIKFLLNKPSKEEIWKYYFGKFHKIKMESINEKIKKGNPFLFKWWRRTNYYLLK